jgi:hypothetical protein
MYVLFPYSSISTPNNILFFVRYDCGFFMLKNLEEEHERMVSWFTQNDLPNIRKLYTYKWLRTEGNKAPWGLYI